MTHFRFFLFALLVSASTAYAGVKYPDFFNDPVKFFEKK